MVKKLLFPLVKIFLNFKKYVVTKRFKLTVKIHIFLL